MAWWRACPAITSSSSMSFMATAMYWFHFLRVSTLKSQARKPSSLHGWPLGDAHRRRIAAPERFTQILSGFIGGPVCATVLIGSLKMSGPQAISRNRSCGPLDAES